MRQFSRGSSIISIGDFTYGENNLDIREWGEGASLSIGKFCSLGDKISIYLGGNHRTDWITTYPFGHTFINQFGPERYPGHPASNGDIVIGSDVWIGADVKIFSGVKIGNGAVIAGSSVITKDVEPYSIVGGNPAKFIKLRFDESIVELLCKLEWWDLSVDQIKNIKEILCHPPSIDVLNKLIEKYRS